MKLQKKLEDNQGKSGEKLTEITFKSASEIMEFLQSPESKTDCTSFTWCLLLYSYFKKLDSFEQDI